MIIQCELCSTRFNLDDTKVKEEGVRVRCSKCRHIFVVKKEKVEPADDTDFDTLLNGLVSASPQEPDLFSGESSAEMDNKAVPDIQKSSLLGEGLDPNSNQGIINTDEKTVQNDYASTVSSNVTQPCEERNDFSSDFSWNVSAESELNTGGDANPGLADSLEKREDDFVAVFSPEVSASPHVDDQPGTVDTDVPGSVGKGIESDPDFTSGISWDSPLTEVSERNETPSPIQSRGQQAEPCESIPEVEQQACLHADPDISTGEMPPAAVVTRRLDRSRLPLVVVLVSVFIIIVMTVSGFYLLNKGPGFINESGLGPLFKWAGINKVDDGGISIRNTSSEFIDNKETGELFVIKGETVNLFKKPRASIQLKATIYDSKGVVLTSKNVYCGNALQKDQLATLPMARIETIMGNQFGDSLSNLGVLSGKAIPFIVVFSKVPKEASEFGLEIVGSTVADR